MCVGVGVSVGGCSAKRWCFPSRGQARSFATERYNDNHGSNPNHDHDHDDELVLGKYGLAESEDGLLKTVSKDLYDLAKSRQWTEELAQELQEDERFGHLVQTFVAACERPNASRLSVTRGLYSLAVLGVQDEQHWTRLSAAIIPKLRRYGPQQLSNTAWAFATVLHEDRELFDELAKQVQRNVDLLNPQELANTAWAFSRLRHGSELFFEAIFRASVPVLESFKPQELANLFWSFAVASWEGMDVPYRELFLRFSLVSDLHEFNAKELGSTAWSLATVDLFDERFMADLVVAAENSLETFGAREMSNLAWAFAKLEFKPEALLDCLAKQAVERIEDFNMQQLANTAWAFATLGLCAEPLFTAIYRRSEEAVGFLSLFTEFKPQELANLTWALAKVSITVDPLMQAIVESDHLIERCKPMELSMIAWAFARLDIRDDVFLGTIVPTAMDSIDSFGLHSLSNIAWSYAKLQLKPEELFHAIAEVLPKFSPNGVRSVACVQLIPAFAKLNMNSDAFYSWAAVTTEALFASPSERVQQRHAMSILWAFACAGRIAQAPPALIKAAFKLGETSDDDEVTLTKLYWIDLCLQIETDGDLRVEPHLAERCTSAARAHSLITSELQQDVQENINQLASESGERWRVESEYRPEGFDGMAVDVALIRDEVGVGVGVGGLAKQVLLVDVNGPTHYNKPLGGAAKGLEPNGSTLMKRRLLAAAGYELVAVPYFQWKSNAQADTKPWRRNRALLRKEFGWETNA